MTVKDHKAPRGATAASRTRKHPERPVKKRKTRKDAGSPTRAILRNVLAAIVGGACVWLAGLLGWLPMRTPPPPAVPDSLSLAGHEWAVQPAPAFAIPPYARFLAGDKIVLDPGHGGRGDVPNFKRGPTGLREAEVNLRVALFLREFLEAAGAEVIMTRDADVYLDSDNGVDLRKRAEIANDARADLLLSIHHNAAPNENANFTTIYYHATPDHSPPSLCAARHLLTGLNDALRLEKHVGCALVSDFVQYKDKGFAVLRHARVPAVLSESSFHSNPTEEERLRDPVYNRREAYGLFLGLARWAQAGLPSVKLIEPTSGPIRGGETITIALNDGLSHRGEIGSDTVKIRAESIVVKLDGKRIGFEPELENRRLRIRLPNSRSGRPKRLFVDFENVFGQHVVHPWIELTNSSR